MFAGAQIGTVVAMIASGVLSQFVGWQSAFYVFGEPYLLYAVDLIIYGVYTCVQYRYARVNIIIIIIIMTFLVCFLH